MVVWLLAQSNLFSMLKFPEICIAKRTLNYSQPFSAGNLVRQEPNHGEDCSAIFVTCTGRPTCRLPPVGEVMEDMKQRSQRELVKHFRAMDNCRYTGVCRLHSMSECP